ncbi:MAG TPA: hypothetical protein DEP53_02945 [Bacteroidetes bacterium]|nr:hypothetical protein [Bacteroidota bacterium]
MNEAAGAEYLAWCRSRLLSHYWPRVQRCVNELSNEQIWWREHDSNNSVGNLVLHLAGNLNQFILSAFGGAPDTRDKEMEFSERTPVSREFLLKKLETTLRDSDKILSLFNPDRFSDKTVLQGRERTYLEVLAIVLEHFALHTGQIIYIAKLKTGKDLKF